MIKLTNTETAGVTAFWINPKHIVGMYNHVDVKGTTLITTDGRSVVVKEPPEHITQLTAEWYANVND